MKCRSVCFQGGIEVGGLDVVWSINEEWGRIEFLEYVERLPYSIPFIHVLFISKSRLKTLCFWIPELFYYYYHYFNYTNNIDQQQQTNKQINKTNPSRIATTTMTTKPTTITTTTSSFSSAAASPASTEAAATSSSLSSTTITIAVAAEASGTCSCVAFVLIYDLQDQSWPANPTLHLEFGSWWWHPLALGLRYESAQCPAILCCVNA